MTRRTFSGCNKYQGLQEEIEAIIIEEDVGEVDLVALPPEPSVVTDKEEGDDDNKQSTAIPRDIPDRVEVFTNRDNRQTMSMSQLLLQCQVCSMMGWATTPKNFPSN